MLYGYNSYHFITQQLTKGGIGGEDGSVVLGDVVDDHRLLGPRTASPQAIRGWGDVDPSGFHAGDVHHVRHAGSVGEGESGQGLAGFAGQRRLHLHLVLLVFGHLGEVLHQPHHLELAVFQGGSQVAVLQLQFEQLFIETLLIVL